MFEIVFFCILSTIIFFTVGQIFNQKIINLTNNKQDNSSINIIFGIIVFGFIGLLINFFSSLNIYINTIIFSFILLYFFLYILKKKGEIKKIVIEIIAISIISSISIYLSNINRPDAGLYHLPYTKILNDFKIIFGVSNIHFRFGHTSLIQYSNALNYNFLFKEKGILIPQALLIISVLYYFGKKIYLNIFNNKLNSNFVFLFICFSFSILNFNRYSSFGNDAGGNILYIFLVYKTFSLIQKKIVSVDDVIFVSLLSLFCFVQKSFLIFSFIIPILLILNFHLKNINKIILSKKFYILSFFIFCFFIKNIITSGCLIYPSTITCIKNLSWYNNDTTSREEIMAEAWAKDWINSNFTENPEEYIKSFNWTNTWTDNHFKILIKKVLPSLILILIVFIFIIASNKKHKKYELSNFEKKIYIILASASIISLCFWFLKFPIYRYGSGIIGGSIIILSFFLLQKKIKLTKLNNYKNFFIIFFSLLISAILFKNILKVNENFNTKYNQYPWPKIYSLTDNQNKLDKLNFEKYKNEGNFMFYIARDGYCMYGPSPCTYYIEKNIIKKKYFNYNVYLINKK